MLRTASTRTNPRSPRTVTGVRHERLLDSTPVLLKLPILDYVPSAVATMPYDDEEGSTDAVTQERKHAAGDQDAAATAVAMATATVVAQPVLAQAIAVEPSPAAPVVEPEPASRTQVESTELSSWWEHWTSGVVLILLILALLVVTIIAMKKPKPARELLAKQADTGGSDLVIPSLETATSAGTTAKIELPATPAPDATAVNGPATPAPATIEPTASVSAPAPQLAAAAHPNTVPSSPANPQTTLAPTHASLVPGELELTLPDSSNSLDTGHSSAQSATTLSASLSAASASPSMPPANPVDGTGTSGGMSLDVDVPLGGSVADSTNPLTSPPPQGFQPPSMATLSPPVGIEQPRLFNDSQLQFGERLPASPVANQSSFPSDPQRPLPSDEAMAAPATGMSGMATLADPASQPSFPARLIGATAGEQATAQPGESAASTEPIATLPAISETAYPNLPAEEIIRAWEMSKALNQAQNNPSNRYSVPSGAAPEAGPGTRLPSQPEGAPRGASASPTIGQPVPGTMPTYPSLPNL